MLMGSVMTGNGAGGGGAGGAAGISWGSGTTGGTVVMGTMPSTKPGFKFGVTNPGSMPALPVFPSRCVLCDHAQGGAEQCRVQHWVDRAIMASHLR